MRAAGAAWRSAAIVRNKPRTGCVRSRLPRDAKLGNASGEPEAKDRAEIERRMIRYSQPVTGHVINGPAVLAEASEELFAAYERGDLGEIEPVFFKLRDIVLAHKAIADRQLLGPAVILP